MPITTSPDPAAATGALPDGAERVPLTTPLVLLLGASASWWYATLWLDSGLTALSASLALAVGWTLLAALALGVPHVTRRLEVTGVALGGAYFLLMLGVSVYAEPLLTWPQDFLITAPLMYAALFRYLGSTRGLLVASAYLFVALGMLLPAVRAPGLLLASGLTPAELSLFCGRLGIGSMLFIVALHGLIRYLELSARRRSAADPLTGLPDRSAFHGTLDRAVRAGGPFTLLLVDIDDLARLNAEHGHAAGDLLLEQLARRVATVPGGRCGRLDGDEFGIILTHGASASYEVARDLQGRLGGPFQLAGRTVFVTVSAGTATFPQHGGTPTELLRAATSAMRAAKRGGKNTTQMFEPVPTVHTDPDALHPALHAAVAQSELVLHYQPVYDVTAGEVVSVEALVRWNHPTIGPVPPSLFIPLAERSRLIIPLGEWVLFEACAQARRWQDAGIPMPVSVNVSAVQLRHPDFVRLVQRALDGSGLQPDHLELEITERELITEEDIGQLERLRLLGVRLALDDFGTGYANLAQLHRLPVHGIKIDRSFVVGLNDGHHDGEGRNLVGMILALAGSLGLKVTVEGIETEEQLTVLRGLGARLVQGYLLSRPAAPADLADVLGRARQLS